MIQFKEVKIHKEITGKTKYRTAKYGNLMRGTVYAELSENEDGSWDALVWDDDAQDKLELALDKPSKRAAQRWAKQKLNEKGIK